MKVSIQVHPFPTLISTQTITFCLKTLIIILKIDLPSCILFDKIRLKL